MAIINFRVSDGGSINYVSYDENITVENFMTDYLKNHTNYVNTSEKFYTFKSNGKVLNMQKFRVKLLKDVIVADGIVNIFRKQDTHYSKENK